MFRHKTKLWLGLRKWFQLTFSQCCLVTVGYGVDFPQKHKSVLQCPVFYCSVFCINFFFSQKTYTFLLQHDWSDAVTYLKQYYLWQHQNSNIRMCYNRSGQLTFPKGPHEKLGLGELIVHPWYSVTFYLNGKYCWCI